MVLARCLVGLVSIVLIGCAQNLAPVGQRSMPSEIKQPTAKKNTASKLRVKKTRPVRRALKPTNSYRVRKGDTLYTIAWRYNLNFKEIAKWNEIKKPYVIRLGQKLKLKPPKTVKRKVSSYKNRKPIKKQPVKVVKKTPVKLKNSWIWPTKGKIVQSFKPAAAKNGIDIAGKEGQPVVAIANGTVVFSNNNLRGYGNLVIVKHSDDLLSAYAHNKTLVVTEGDRVKQGQQIATMGKVSGRGILHFEIRELGKSVNPMRYLSKR